MTVWLFPIEPIEERYSADWMRWWPAQLHALGVHVRTMLGERLRGGIEAGQFLDVVDTHYWKATQLAEFCRAVHEGHVHNGDAVLFLDAWNPAVEAVAYMRDMLKAKWRLVGIFHAGTYDRWDALAQAGMDRWAAHTERGWMAALDDVCVATDFHRMLLENLRGGTPGGAKVHVTGLPLYAQELSKYAQPWEARPRLVAFPHRLAPEKAPEEFDTLRALYGSKYGDDGTEWVRTKDVCRRKAAYYEVLGRARVAVSAAQQETWGIAMIEALALGAWPVAPKRLSYPETLREYLLYETPEQAVELIHVGLEARCAPVYEGARWETAIGRIVRVCEA